MVAPPPTTEGTAAMEALSLPAEIRLRVGEFKKFCLARGWVTETACAAGIGVAGSTLNRILSGKTRPGTAFIAAVLAAFPALEFDHLFEVIDTDGADDGEAA